MPEGRVKRLHDFINMPIIGHIFLPDLQCFSLGIIFVFGTSLLNAVTYSLCVFRKQDNLHIDFMSD